LIQTEFSLIKKLVVNLYPNEYSLKRLQTSKFDIADYLDSNEMIAEYLNAVLEEGNDDEIVTAIGHIANKSTKFKQVLVEC
jgi:hypothetical protein